MAPNGTHVRCNGTSWHNCAILCITIYFLFSLSSVNAQLPDDLYLPDSCYIPDELLVWFSDSTLNLNYVGGYGNMEGYPFSSQGKEALPLNSDFIRNPEVVQLFEQLGVQEIRKVVPWIDPFTDTISISRSGDTIRVQPLWNLLQLKFNPDSETDILLAAFILLKYFPEQVVWAQPNLIYKNGSGDAELSFEVDNSFCQALLTNDTFSSMQLSLENSLAGIHADEAWKYNTGSGDVKVAVIDDGIFHLNPDFAPTGKLALSPKQVYGAGGPGGHGTDMAGIIGAVRDNNQGIAGIVGGHYVSPQSSFGCPLYILDIFRSSPYGNFTVQEAFNAITEASYNILGPPKKGHGCHTINFSIYQRGTSPDPLMKLAVAISYDNDVVFNACMGNARNADPQYPAAIEDHYLIAVGAKADGYRRHDVGSYGQHMDFMAPGFGNHIYTTFDNSSWDYSGGLTSAANAHSTGVSALLISEYQLHAGTNIDKPYCPEDIENLMEAGCVDQLGQISTSHDIETGWGLLNAANTLSFLDPPYVLKHYTGTVNITQLPSSQVSLPGHVPFYSLQAVAPPYVANDLLANTVQYRVSSTLQYPDQFQSVLRVWGRGQKGDGRGYAKARTFTQASYNWTDGIMELNFTDVSAFTSTSCEAETYFYFGDSLAGGSKWLPFDPTSKTIVFDYSVLGILQPTNVQNPANLRHEKVLSIASIFPNPINRRDSKLYIECVSRSNEKEVIFSLTDCLGRIVRTVAYPRVDGGNSIVELYVGDLESGLYLLSVRDRKAIDTKVISVVR